jgi:3'-5' exoribonuclease 1
MLDNLIIVDLEATCWERSASHKRQETIEIGAVCLNTKGLQVESEFSIFIKPIEEPELSDFCTQLTSIRQQDVDDAPLFPEAFSKFLQWIGNQKFILSSWGAYDPRQLEADCNRHGVAYPAPFRLHANIKKKFCSRKNRKPCGMKKAMNILGLAMDGTHHRGIDDARNIAKIAHRMLSENAFFAD